MSAAVVNPDGGGDTRTGADAAGPAVAAGAPQRLRIRLLAALCISQGCWWTSVLMGLLNSTLRRWAGG